MNKLIVVVLMIITLASCSTTNKYDADIAKARYKYGEKINTQKPVFELRGSITCSEEALDAKLPCLTVYNQNQRHINVEPKTPDRLGQLLDFTGRFINPLFNWKMAQSNNELSATLAEQNTELFSTIFTSVADIKGSGTNYTYTDSYNTSDSYNSQDTSNVDSLNTSNETSNISNTSSNTNNTSNTSSSSIADSYNSDSEVSTETVNNTQDNP